MTGTTGLKGLYVDCIIGIYEHERITTQALVIDVELDYDFAGPAASDAIADAVDYDRVVSGVTRLARQGAFQLIETLAEEAARFLLGEFPQVERVRIEVRKPAAIPSASCSFVRVERARS